MQASGLLKDDIVLSIPTERVRLRHGAAASGGGEGPRLDCCVAGVRREQEEADPVIRCWWCRWVTSPPRRRWCGRWTRSTTPGPNSAPTPWRTSSVSTRPAGRPAGRAYIEPQRVQDAKHVRVLLAKSAISTGWDCPRAEVLVSMRPAKDRTHITQLLDG